jgi:hypothetical protein
VQRQYTGTAGRIENAQLAVFPAYASGRGYALIDREVYPPRCWADDPTRRAAAGVPEQMRFATKITLARRVLARALDAGTRAKTSHHLRRTDPRSSADIYITIQGWTTGHDPEIVSAGETGLGLT